MEYVTIQIRKETKGEKTVAALKVAHYSFWSVISSSNIFSLCRFADSASETIMAGRYIGNRLVSNHRNWQGRKNKNDKVKVDT